MRGPSAASGRRSKLLFWYTLVAFNAAVMSVCGFPWVYMIVLGFGAAAFGAITDPTLELMLSLGYLVLIVPCLGSGFVIRIHSLIVVAKERSFASAGVAGWNTFFMAYNTYNAVRTVPSFSARS